MTISQPVQFGCCCLLSEFFLIPSVHLWREYYFFFVSVCILFYFLLSFSSSSLPSSFYRPPRQPILIFAATKFFSKRVTSKQFLAPCTSSKVYIIKSPKIVKNILRNGVRSAITLPIFNVQMSLSFTIETSTSITRSGSERLECTRMILHSMILSIWRLVKGILVHSKFHANGWRLCNAQNVTKSIA